MRSGFCERHFQVRGTVTTLIGGILTSGGLMIWMHYSSVSPVWFAVAVALLAGVVASTIIAFNIWTIERIRAARHIGDSCVPGLGGVRTIATGLALGYASWFALRDVNSFSPTAILAPGVFIRLLVAFMALLPITSWLAFVTHVKLARGRGSSR